LLPRALAARGHEIGNHAIFHPCLRNVPQGGRDWVRPEYALESYTVPQMVDELQAANTTLLALDGETVRTLGYNCGDTTAGGHSYVDAARPLFLAARIGEDRIAADVRALDPMLVPSWMVQNVSGDEMIAFVKKAVGPGASPSSCSTASVAATASTSPARPTNSSSPGSLRTGRRSGRTRSSG